jgi:hypothetical protein
VRFLSAPILILIVAGASIGAWGTMRIFQSNLWSSSSTPYTTYCGSNKNIHVDISSFQVQFIYTGTAKDYLVLINQDANSHFQSSAGTCPLYFVDAVRVMGVGGSSHVFSSLGLSPKSFVFASNGGFTGPQTASEIFPDFVIAYVGEASYSGPLVIDIYSSS